MTAGFVVLGWLAASLYRFGVEFLHGKRIGHAHLYFESVGDYQ